MPSLRRRTKRYRRYSKPKPRKEQKPREDLGFDVPKHPLVEDIGDPRIREIMRGTNSSEKEAKSILTLEGQFPSHTMPELVAMDWLNGAQADYVSQASVMGGRRQRGGMVPDFLVRQGGHWNAWLIQGDYYHSSGFQERYQQQGRDMVAKLRLTKSYFAGVTIERVITMNESQIYDEKPLIFQLAMLGQELPF